jgi:hypothetical protein
MSTEGNIMAIDMDKLQEFLGRFVPTPGWFPCRVRSPARRQSVGGNQ